MIEDIYKFDKCTKCGKYLPLKNSLCINCQDYDLPDFMKDLFKGKNDDTKKN